MGSSLIFGRDTEESEDGKERLFDIPLGNRMFFHQLCSSRPAIASTQEGSRRSSVR
jgi:hypothetical protein